MKQNYDDSLRRVLASEGGYTDDPRDPGGATNWGITIADARMYWKAEATPADVRAMPRSVAEQIYKAKYWQAVRGDELPSGVDYTVFDFGVNSGVRRAIKYLQRALGVGMDGEIGPSTMAALAEADPAKVIVSVCDARLAFLQSLGTWSAFGKGWGRRVAEVKAASLQMAKAAPVVAPTPAPKPPSVPTVPPPKPAQPAPAPQQAPQWGFFVGLIRAAVAALTKGNQK